MASPFRSFWMAGFEGADHVNGRGVALDMADASGHRRHLDDDYARAAALGLRTVRESIGWRSTECPGGRFDFTRARAIGRAAERHGIQVVWTLMHYGTPPDVDLRDDAFIDRFAAFAAAAVRAIGDTQHAAPVVNPVNEIGYLAWVVSETGQMWPYRADLRVRDGSSDTPVAATAGSGYAVKRRLVRGVLAAADAMRRIAPRVRFLHIEPVVHVTAPRDRPELTDDAARIDAYQWQAWDLIAGLAEPELGGSPDILDRVGVNHYHSGQWEVATEERLWWHLDDPRRVPLGVLLQRVWDRYRRPLLIAETGHFGAGRARWLDGVGLEVEAALAAGIPFEGICLYPIVDRPDWDDPSHWHRSGLWDVVDAATGPGAGRLERTLAVDYAAALARWQRRLAAAAPPA